MDGQPPTECTCGSTNFERIVIERRGRPLYRTAFVACAECRVMYFVPEPCAAEPAPVAITWSQPKPPT